MFSHGTALLEKFLSRLCSDKASLQSSSDICRLTFCNSCENITIHTIYTGYSINVLDLQQPNMLAHFLNSSLLHYLYLNTKRNHSLKVLAVEAKTFKAIDLQGGDS